MRYKVFELHLTSDQGHFRFDLSYGTIDITPLASSPKDSRMVIIGEHLKKKRSRWL